MLCRIRDCFLVIFFGVQFLQCCEGFEDKHAEMRNRYFDSYPLLKNRQKFENIEHQRAVAELFCLLHANKSSVLFLDQEGDDSKSLHLDRCLRNNCFNNNDHLLVGVDQTRITAQLTYDSFYHRWVYVESPLR